MAESNHSAALVDLRGIPHRATATAATVATASEHAALHEAVQKLVAHRAEFFILIESLEAVLGRDVDVRELEGRIDSDYAGRLDVTVHEVLTILYSAAPLRAVAIG